MKERTVVIAAGGTGGHFFPAEALATALHRRGYKLVLMTDSRAGLKTEGIFSTSQQFILPGAGIAGHSLKRKLSAAIALLVGTAQARNILKSTIPHAVVGFGGYPSIPPILGAYLLKRKTSLILHEGNAVLGYANRLLAHLANAIGISFPKVAHVPTRCPTTLTGMPVRKDIADLYNTTYQPPHNGGPISLFIWGGSLGARIFSTVVPQALSLLPEEFRQRLHITQQVRAEDIPTVQSQYEAAGIKARIEPFFNTVPAILKQAHLVIGRAGGSSVAELTLAGKPAIFVPLPIAANDEQTANASILDKAGAGWLIPQSEFSSEALSSLLLELFQNPQKLERAAHTIRQHAHPQAAELLADLVENCIASSFGKP